MESCLRFLIVQQMVSLPSYLPYIVESESTQNNFPSAAEQVHHVMEVRAITFVFIHILFSDLVTTIIFDVLGRIWRYKNCKAWK